MKFRPKLMTWVLARMPHKNVEEACQVMRHYFPEAPTIPLLTSSRIRPGLVQGVPGLSIDKEGNELLYDLSGKESELAEFYERYLSDNLDYFAIRLELEQSLYKLAEMFKEKPWPELKVVRFSSLGPYTFGLILKDKNGVSAFYNETMRDILVKQFSMQLRWREKKIRELFPGVQTFIQIGEPSLGLFTSSVGAGSWDIIKNAINEVIERVEGISCVHCCDNFDWPLLMKTNIDVINFDAYKYGESMALYPDELKRFMERGGMIAWGIVPIAGGEDETPSSLVERMERLIQLVADKGIDKKLLLELSWITPSCTTGSMSVEQAERVFAYTGEVSQRMREKYFSSIASEASPRERL
ncbi:hypothetical protein ACFLWW_03885 [Chloroflexota bacterium]